jgi:hypothetical protein
VLVAGLVLGTGVLLRRRFHDPWCVVVALLPLCCLLVYASTDQSLVPGTTRYVVMALPECAVLLGVLARSMTRRQMAALGLLVACGVGLSVRDTVRAARDTTGVNPNQAELRLVETVQDRGLVRGYGDFWNANIVTYLSGYTLDVVPVGCRDTRTESFVWFVDSTRFRSRAPRSFYVSEERPGLGTCPLDQVLAQFGPPIDQITVGAREILVYDYDIGQRMTR